MELLILVLYDALAVGILLLAVNKSARVGFAQTVTAFLGRIAAFFAALFIGKAGSQLIYRLFLKKGLTNFLRESIADSATVSDIAQSLELAADSLPDFVANFYGIGNSETMLEALGGSLSDAVTVLEQQLVEPAVTGFLHIVLFLLSFFILSILVSNFAKAVGFAAKLPIIHTVDRFLGGILGILQGGINLYLIALAARFLLYFLGDAPAFFNEDIIADTFLWSRIYAFDPFDFFS